MNCNYYQDEFEKYLDGSLPESDRQYLEIHLKSCHKCSEQFRITKLSEMVFSEEKSFESNPFLSTRVMAQLEANKTYKAKSFAEILTRNVLRPVLISAVIAIAVILGISIGNLSITEYISQQVPDEILYMDDAVIESLDLFLPQ